MKFANPSPMKNEPPENSRPLAFRGGFQDYPITGISSTSPPTRPRSHFNNQIHFGLLAFLFAPMSTSATTPADGTLLSRTPFTLTPDIGTPDTPHDGDGNRVKSVLNSQTTLFIGEHYQKEGSLVTKYYFAGSQRVAMRQGGTVHYLLSDHLGSTSVVYNASTGAAVTQLYKPWGEVRYSSGALPTKYTYTGQYSNIADFGLMYYRARWYDPSLGRFAQADTVVPGAGNPMAWDRYAYALNNSLRYSDPSGHEICLDDGNCGSYTRGKIINPVEYWKKLILDEFGVILSDDIDAWEVRNASTIYFALFNQNLKLAGKIRTFSQGTVYKFDKLDTCKNGQTACYNATTSWNGSVTFRSTSYLANQNIYHEFGHVMDFRTGAYFSGELAKHEIYTQNGGFVMGGPGDYMTYQRNAQGYANQRVKDRNWNSASAKQHASCADMTDEWCQAGNSPSEEWADLWANHVVGNFSSDSFGVTRLRWVTHTLNKYFATSPY